MNGGVLGVIIYLKQDVDLHMVQLMPLPFTVSCFSKIQIGFIFLVLAHLGSLGQKAVKHVCVCVDRGSFVAVHYMLCKFTSDICVFRARW